MNIESESLFMALILASQALEAELGVERCGNTERDMRLVTRLRIRRMTTSCNEESVSGHQGKLEGEKNWFQHKVESIRAKY